MAGVNKAVRIGARYLITPREVLQGASVEVENGQIVKLGEAKGAPDFEGHCLIPGMLDLHINGTRGADAAHASQEVLERMSRALAEDGVTGFLPTLISDREEPLLGELRALSGSMEATRGGARALGIHLEGPFLNPERRGAHRPEALRRPSVEEFDRYQEAASGGIVKLTIAPELPGALEVIRHARRELPVVSLGHTAADFDTAVRAFEAGANAVTHLFNAMNPLHHRQPGLLAAALNSPPRIKAQVIADGLHVHPEVVRLIYRCKGAEGVVLVTDAVSAAGMPDGDYRVGSVTVHLRDGACRDAEGRLAGSALRMDEGLRNLARWCGAQSPLQLAGPVSTATLQPAELLGLERKGRIAPGADADLVLLDEQLRVGKTWVEGELVYDAASRS